MTPPLTWVVGSGGLLGSSLRAALERRGAVWDPAARIAWGSADAERQVRNAARTFLSEARGGRWHVAWCAGAAVTDATPESLAREHGLLSTLLAELRSHGTADCGSVYLTSSAGGVYSGSVGQPFSEATPVRPLSPYGAGKLAAESELKTFHAATGVPALIGRVSNLYGPKQNLAKGQGLISHLARTMLLRKPLSLYVPRDTMRDYLVASDAGELVADAIDRLVFETSRSGPACHTKIIASHQPATIGYLVTELARVTKRKPLVVYGASPSSGFQARDVRLRSTIWTDLDRRAFVPYPVGLMQTVEALSVAQRAGRLT